MIHSHSKTVGMTLLTISAGSQYQIARAGGGISSAAGWWHRQLTKWQRDAKEILHQTRLLMLLLTHSGTPLRSRTVAGCAVLYLVSPIQLIPSFIPVIGQLDDVFVLWAGMKLARKFTPQSILEECEARATCGKFFSSLSGKPHCVQENIPLPLQHDP